MPPMLWLPWLCVRPSVCRAKHCSNTLKPSKACRTAWKKIGKKNGVVFIDDSKGTNVGATAAAIAGLQNPLFVIFGRHG